MFSWVCPDCGDTVDIAHDSCPNCGKGGNAPAATAQATPQPPAAPPAQPAAPPAAPTQVVVQPVAVPPPSPPPAPAPSLPTLPEETFTWEPEPSGGLELKFRHLLLTIVLVAAAVAGAIFLSDGTEGLRAALSTLGLEDPPEADYSPVQTFAVGVLGPIEVSGIRTYYDDEYQMHVRALVANHSSDEQSVAIRALLRVRQAGEQAPPIATFEVVISDPLPPNGSQEIDVPLASMGSLASMPPWDQIRVDIEPLGTEGG